MKKRTKTLVAMMLVIACIMSVGLTACNADSPGATNTNSPATQTPGPTPSETPDATPSVAPTESGPAGGDAVENPFDLFVYDLPDGYKKPNELAGTVTLEEYTTYVYDEDGVPGEEISAAMYVYTPYGYDPSKEYNILYLMHGGGESEGYWFGEGPYAEGGEKYNKATAKYTTNVVDNMIADGVCGDVIIVTPTFYNNYNATNNLARFRYEMKNDIIPFVEAKYSTYAGGDVSAENLVATRDHRAYAGFSMGSMTGFEAIWGGCVDYFAYIGNYSGCDPNGVGIVETVVNGLKANYADYDIKYWYNGTGTKDTAEKDHLDNYAKMLELSGDIFSEGENYAEGDNCIMVDKPDKGHAYNGWIVDLYNSLLVFFKVP